METRPVQIVTTSGGRTHPEAIDVNAMFDRVLRSWAMDLLRLRKHGLDRPALRMPESVFESDGPGEDTYRAAA